ncbi:MAG: transcriptional repressor LexA [Planctomycetia bacterium]|nr:transcriptional repressor LexA [Planctomycetia bacterium]
MADLSTLTQKQREIYDYIKEHIEANGYPPTVRDIGKAFQIESPNGVMCHLNALVKKGAIIRKGQSARAIRLVDAPTNSNKGGTELPLFGSVAAGVPIAAEATHERFNFQEMFGGPNHFVLAVRGQSMIEDHIDDGDYVVIRPQATAENGERVVAMIDNEVTLKKFYQKEGRITLQPCNGSMKPIEVNPESDTRVLGLLVGVLRKCR